jgi:tetratricopeptide (TPR) repeat protein
MIVKNESRVILRCLRSVVPYIDSWIVVDTGSTDDTMDLVRRALSAIPGELHQRPWVDFSHNRNEAIELARPWGDYLLFIDADEELIVDPDFQLPKLTADSYRTRHTGARSDSSFERTQFIKSALPWRYVGVLHEVVICPEARAGESLPGIVCLGHFDSARNQIDAAAKYAKDATILENALKTDPDNARYVFYLAQSLKDSGDRRGAIAAYERRARMGGWEEEVWYSLYQVGLLHMDLAEPPQGVHALLRAFQFRPSRAEPLVALAHHYRVQCEWQLAYLFAERAVEIKRPADILFLSDSVYEWKAADELSIAAFYVGRYEESLRFATRLLKSKTLPADQRPRISANRNFAATKLGRRAGPIG